MRVLYPTLGGLVLLAIFAVAVGWLNRDLLRVRAYGEFASRLAPLLVTGAFIGGCHLSWTSRPRITPPWSCWCTSAGQRL